LVEELDKPDYLAPLLYGQWVFHGVRADYKPALSFAEQLEQFGEARSDDAARLLGRFVQGYTHLQLGELTSARALCEQSDGMSNPAHRASYAAVTAEDPHVVMTGALATALAVLGYVDQGRAKIDEALVEARRLDNASTLALTLSQACRVAISVASPRGGAGTCQGDGCALEGAQSPCLFGLWKRFLWLVLDGPWADAGRSGNAGERAFGHARYWIHY
jgi:hypothetical protein